MSKKISGVRKIDSYLQKQDRFLKIIDNRHRFESIYRNQDDLLASIKLANHIISQNSNIRNSLDSYYRYTFLMSERAERQSLKLVSDYISRNYTDVFKNMNDHSVDAVKSLMLFQSSLLLTAAGIKKPSQDIRKLTHTLQYSMLTQSSFSSFLSVYNKPIIEAQNLAILKLDNTLKTTVSKNLPKAVTAAVNGININAAIRLTNSDIYSYDTNQRVLFVEDNTMKCASIKSFNIIVSFLELVNRFTEEEMLEFHTFLCNHPLAGFQHPIGQRIAQYVQELSNEDLIGFDTEVYYRGRKCDQDQRPWSEQELKQAPYGIPHQGRFNIAGINSLYLADSEQGAAIEVQKHDRSAIAVQIGHFATRNQVRILDIAGWNNSLARYCAFPLDTRVANYQIRPEYLVPCFFAECLRLARIDGIKYRGGRHYSNYVFWEDHYFTLQRSTFHRYEREVAAVND